MMELIKRMSMAVAAMVSCSVVAEEMPTFLPEAGLGHEQAADPERDLGFELGVDWLSNYVWRGQLLTDDPVVQPSASVSYGGLSLNVWASVDTTDINENSGSEYRIQEVDYTAAYAFSPRDGLDLSGGLIVYDFPGTGFKTTTELFAAVSISAIPLTPTFGLYYDIDEVDGWYANFSIGHEFPLNDQLSIGIGAGIGYGDDNYNLVYFGVDDSTFEDFTVSASLDYTPNDTVSFSLAAGYSELTGSAVREVAADPDVFTIGMNMTVTF